MEDDSGKNDKLRLKKKLNSLQNLISDLHEQNKLLQTRKILKRKHETPNINLKPRQRSLSTATKLQQTIHVNHNEFINNEVCDKNRYEMKINCNRAANDASNAARIMESDKSDVGDSEDRLSRLAKQVWINKTDKLHKSQATYPRFSFTSQWYAKKRGFKSNLQEKDMVFPRHNALNVNNVNSVTVSRKNVLRDCHKKRGLKTPSIPLPENSLFTKRNLLQDDPVLNRAINMKDCVRQQMSEKGFKRGKNEGEKELPYNPSPRENKNRRNFFIENFKVTKEKQQINNEGAENSAKVVAVGRQEDSIDPCQASVTLKTSSERLSSWKKSILARKSFQRYSKGTIRYAAGYAKPETRKCLVENSSRQVNNAMQNLSQPDPTKAVVSTNERLSTLAKLIWEKRKERRPYRTIMNKEIERGSQFNLLHKHARICQPSTDFKWISHKQNAKSFLNRRKRVVLKNSRFKIVKESAGSNQTQDVFKYSKSKFTFRKSGFSFAKRRQAYLAGRHGGANVWWKSQNLQRTIPNRSRIQKATEKVKDSKVLFTNIHGKKFLTDTSGRRLTRLSIFSADPPCDAKVNETTQSNAILLPNRRNSVIFHAPSKYKIVRRHSVTHYMSSKVFTASRMVKKSVFCIHQQNARKYVKKQYCMFYNRFGKCKNGNKCRFIHDPEKVAVCTRFLRGTCKDENCLFSHKIDSTKMPTCSFFLNGACHRENCPFAHVKVSGTADVCKDFLKGYCPSGNKCLKRHVLECEEFSKKGVCAKGEKCKLYHRKRCAKRRRSSSLSGTKAPRPFLKRMNFRQYSDEIFNLAETTDKDLKIKPSFAAIDNPEKTTVGMSRLKRKRRFDWKKEKEDEEELI